MKSDRVGYIIKKLYYSERGEVGVLGTQPMDGYLFWKRKPFKDFVRNMSTVLSKWWVLTSIGLVAILTIYYFNTIMIRVQDCGAAAATIQAHEQRRHDLSINLAKAVAIYAEHESRIFTNTAELRAAMMGNVDAAKKIAPQDGGKTTSALLGKIFGIAEQYPDLKLSAEFNHLLDAIIAIEKDIASARTDYNTASNKLSTALGTFPGNFYGRLFGFKAFPLFESDESARKFIPMNFDKH